MNIELTNDKDLDDTDDDLDLNDEILINSLLVKGFYNRFAAEVWMWMIFLEWINNYLFS
jgi:hypothetical protein